MNILQVSHSFLPCYDSGGVVRSVHTLSKGLLLLGHNVTVYTTDGCKKRLNVEKNKCVDFDGLNVFYFSNLSNTLRIRFKIATPYYLLRIINKSIQNFDIVHIHEQRTVIALIVAYFAKKHNIPFVIHARGSTTLESGRIYYKKVFDAIYGKKMLRNASKLIALNEVEFNQYKNMGADPQNIVIIPNGIDLSSYNQLPQKGVFRKKYHIENKEKIILFLGRLNIIKGLDLLINAFSLLTKQVDNIKLVIVGPDDGCIHKLKKLTNALELNEHIVFTGPLYENDKQEAYVDADIYVLPSRYETFPNTVLEAAVCQTPSIVTDRCGIADLVGKNMGLVVEWDKKSLKDGMYSLITDDGKRKELGIRGKIFVRENLDSKIVAEKIENLYKSIIF